MIMGISGHFVGERKTLGVMKTRENELRFVVNPRLVSAAGERVQPFAGPVAILVDAMSGSASECFAGGMQSIGRVRVFGQPSMGQALPALFDRMPNGDVLIHAYGDFVTAEGTRLEGRGVIPDEVVPLVRADLLAGRDRTLEVALAWIDRPRTRRLRPESECPPLVAESGDQLRRGLPRLARRRGPRACYAPTFRVDTGAITVALAFGSLVDSQHLRPTALFPALHG